MSTRDPRDPRDPPLVIREFDGGRYKVIGTKAGWRFEEMCLCTQRWFERRRAERVTEPDLPTVSDLDEDSE